MQPPKLAPLREHEEQEVEHDARILAPVERYRKTIPRLPAAAEVVESAPHYVEALRELRAEFAAVAGNLAPGTFQGGLVLELPALLSSAVGRCLIYHESSSTSSKRIQGWFSGRGEVIPVRR